jgi:hypothetical protein
MRAEYYALNGAGRLGSIYDRRPGVRDGCNQTRPISTDATRRVVDTHLAMRGKSVAGQLNRKQKRALLEYFLANAGEYSGQNIVATPHTRVVLDVTVRRWGAIQTVEHIDAQCK